MGRITVLDPTAPPPDDEAGPGPDVDTVEGRLVGIRYDRAWRSFDWVVDEWTRLLEGDGARVRHWCAGNRIGDEGELTRAELDAFAAEVDLAVAGLGN
jgi:hypothetical protein